MEAVRRASEADSPALAKMLARAFDDDPVAEWVSPHRRTRERMLERFHAARLRHLLPHREVWMTAGGEAAAVWAPPEQGGTTLRHELELFAAALEPVLEQCDRDGIGAYLESSKERNVDYYARFGFQTRETLHLPGGPDMWLMWREPRH